MPARITSSHSVHTRAASLTKPGCCRAVMPATSTHHQLIAWKNSQDCSRVWCEESKRPRVGRRITLFYIQRRFIVLSSSFIIGTSKFSRASPRPQGLSGGRASLSTRSLRKRRRRRCGLARSNAVVCESVGIGSSRLDSPERDRVRVSSSHHLIYPPTLIRMKPGGNAVRLIF